ncbi:MAG: protein kinase [Lentisphaerae bacterium]|nr:protein kinase [Lentisphaerota bacterium]
MDTEKKPEVDVTQKISLPSSDKVAPEEQNDSKPDKEEKSPELSTTKKLFFSKKRIVDDVVRSTSKPAVVTNIEPADKDLSLNHVKDLYELKEKFSEGAQGELLFAFDKALKREVAVKSLKKDTDPASVEQDIKLFVSEARIMAQLDHPSIIPLYGLHCDSERGFYLVMKHISGKTLEEYLREIIALYQTDGLSQYNEHRSLGIRLEYFIKICEAVQYAHSKGIIHRDLKPANILIGDFGEIYVMDWGLASLTKDEDENADDADKTDDKGKEASSEKGKNYCAGTPSYMAPELIQGEKYSPQTDIFALGMILFEIVTLRKAVTGGSVNKILNRILNCDFNKFKHRFGKIKFSGDMKAIIAKAICNKKQRYKAVSELCEDVKLFLMREEISARPDNFLRKGTRWMSNHKLAAFSMVLFILLCLSALTINSLFEQNKIIRLTRQREMILMQFQNKVNDKGHAIERMFLHLKGLLTSAAVRAGDLLSGNVPRVKPKLYMNRDYLNPATAPMDLQKYTSYAKKISLAHPVFKLAPGVKFSQVEDDIYKIYPLKSSFISALFRSDPKLEYRPVIVKKDTIIHTGQPLTWIYIALNDGVFMAYPGKGGYPEDFDPRKRPWYLSAFDKEGVVWSRPYLCASGQGIVTACTESVFDSHGNFRGVIGMDISFSYITSKLFKDDGRRDLKKYLLESDGKIIVSTDYNKSASEGSITKNSFLSLKKFPFTEIFRQAVINNGGLYRAKVEGEKYLFAFSYIPTIKWYYVEQVNEDDPELGLPLNIDE